MLAAVSALVVTRQTVVADVTSYLPGDTTLVVSLDVKQLLRAPLVRDGRPAVKQAFADIAKALDAVGVDPAKDLDRVILAVGDQLKATSMLMLVQGQFDQQKVEGRLRERARVHQGDVQPVEIGGATVYQIRLPPPQTPNPRFTPPNRYELTVLDSSTIALAIDRAAMTEALAKKAGSRKTSLRPKLADHVGRMDLKETLALVFVPAESQFDGTQMSNLTAVTGGVSVADSVKTDIRITATDADSARRLGARITDELENLKQLVPVLAALHPDITRKDQEVIRAMADTLKVDVRRDAVAITSTISRDQIEKLGGKD
jgi:hypothetical protein